MADPRVATPGDAGLAALERVAERHEVEVGGRRIVWRRFGDGGLPVVLLHGGHGNWRHWARNIDALGSRHRVWVPDLPGYGESDSPPEATLESLVGATAASLDALVGGSTPVSLVGFSFGGLVAASLAAQRGSVARLALFGPGGHGGSRRPRGPLRPWREAADRDDPVALADLMRHNLSMHMLHDPASIDAVAVRIHTDACLGTRFRSRPISLAGGLKRVLEPYRGPLLLVWGAEDVTAVPDEAARALGEGRTGCRAEILPGAGHWVQYERAEAVNDLLVGWLDAGYVRA